MMIRNILSTFASRIITSVLTFVVVLLASRSLGPERYGTIGLVMVAVQFTILFSSLIGGSSLVYYASRMPVSTLFFTSTLWTIIISLSGTYLLAVFELYPFEYFFWALAISIVSAGALNNMYLLVGGERIFLQNILHVLQVSIHVVFIFLFFHVIKDPSIERYLLSVLISQTVCLLLGFWFLRAKLIPFRISSVRQAVGHLLSYGFWVQLGAVLQLANYRLSFYMVDHYAGRAALGIFTLAVQLCEALWILPRSIAMVQFSKISNLTDNDSSVRITSVLFHLTMLTLILTAIVVLLIPEPFFIIVFGEGYTGLKTFMNILLIGVVAFSGVIIIGHHFAGINKVWLNVIISASSLFILVILSFWLVPQFGVYGAAWANSGMYVFSLIISVILYSRIAGQNILSYSTVKHNWKKVLNVFKNYFTYPLIHRSDRVDSK